MFSAAAPELPMWLGYPVLPTANRDGIDEVETTSRPTGNIVIDFAKICHHVMLIYTYVSITIAITTRLPT